MGIIPLSERYHPVIHPVPIPKHLRPILPYRWIWNKVHKRREDCIVIICGPTGTGKTTYTTSFAEMFDVTYMGKTRFPYFTKDFQLNDFNIDNPYESVSYHNFDKVTPRFCYGIDQVSDYWEWLKKRARDGHNTTGIVGAVDEVQTLWAAREFYSSKNKKAITQFVTGRHLRTIHALIGPEYSALDKNIVRRCHLVIEVQEKGFDKETNQPFVSFIPKIPVFLDPKKPPILRYFRGLDGLIWDKPIYQPMPSNKLYHLVQAKELFWKTSDRDDWGNVNDPSKPKEIEMNSMEKKQAIIEEKALTMRGMRHSFVVKFQGKTKYSSNKIAAQLQLPLSWGYFFIPYFERWDKEEGVIIENLSTEAVK